MPLLRGLSGPSSTSPSFFTSDLHGKQEASPGDSSYGSTSRHMQTQSWRSEEFEPVGEEILQRQMSPSSAAATAAVNALRPETLPGNVSNSPYCKSLSPVLAATPRAKYGNQQSWSHGVAAAAAVSSADYAAATRADEDDNADDMEISLSCDGADARYVEVANERAFSALQLRSGSGGNGLLSPDYTRGELGTASFASTPPPPLPQQRESATSATLTSVRASHTGTPTPAQLHTPLHSTSYGSNCYNRLLSNALLGGLEGRRSSVFTLSARSTPPARTQCAGQEKAPINAATIPAGTVDVSVASSVGKQKAAIYEASKSTQGINTTATPVPQAQSTPCAKQNAGADSTLAFLCSSPHHLTWGESKCKGEDDDGAGSTFHRTRLFWADDMQQRQQRQKRNGVVQDAAQGGEYCVAVSPNGQTPPITTPVSYFQHAPPVWTGNPPGMRLRFHRSNSSAALFESTGDAQPSANNGWQLNSASGSHYPAMRTAGVVPHATCSPLMMRSSLSEQLPSANFSSTPPTANNGSAVTPYDTPLFAPSDPMYRMARMVSGSCTPPSLQDLNREEGTLMSDAVPTSPLHLPSSVARDPGFCMRSITKPTFVLPSSTAHTASSFNPTGRYASELNENNSDDALLNNAERCSSGGVVASTCATPVPVHSQNSSFTTRFFCGNEGDNEQRDCSNLQHTPTRALFAVPQSLRDDQGAAERSSETGTDAAQRSLWTSPSTLTRLLMSSYILTTPVRHHDNSIRDYAQHHRNSSASLSAFNGGAVDSCASGFPPWHSSRPLSINPVATSSAVRLPGSPISIITPVFLSPARNSVRYSPMTGAADGAGIVSHMIPHRDAFAFPASRSAAAVAQTGAHRHGSISRRNAFHFVRALTASGTSSNPLHSPFFWGCFGVLVAQGMEVWCVGKGQPFRIYPQESAEEARDTRIRQMPVVSITAVASTAVLSATTWEEAAMVAGDGVASVLATAAGQDVVFLAVGTSTGDVYVYAFRKSSASAPGAVPVYLSAPQQQEQEQTPVYSVKLQRFGELKCVDRVGNKSQMHVGEERYGNIGYHGTSSAHTFSDVSQCHAISVLRVVGPWLYIGDQSGLVSRYDLRHTFFLHSANESSRAVPTAVAAARARSTTESGSSTPARALASPNPRMPVHHFARPSVNPINKTILKAPFPEIPTTTTTGTLQKPTLSPYFHFAVHTDEPVYNLEVTEDHAYVAVGTQTRLLVYRVAEMLRVTDCGVAEASVLTNVPTLSSGVDVMTVQHRSVTDPSPVTVLDVTMDATAPIVVVSDAPQPVRCFAWMLCDYEALASTRVGLRWSSDALAGSTIADGDTGDHNNSCDGAAGLSTHTGTTFGSISSFTHTPTPSLAFATACYDAVSRNGALGAIAIEQGGNAAPHMCFKTSLQLYRVATQSVVASCTLDYPVHVVRAVAGTTRIIVGTGSLAEWPLHPQPTLLSPTVFSFASSSPVTPVREQTSQQDSPQSEAMTPTPLPLAPSHHPSFLAHTRSQSATVAMPTLALSSTLSRSPSPALQLRRRSAPAAAAAMSALRTLTGAESHPLAGLWHTPNTVSSAARHMTRMASASTRSQSNSNNNNVGGVAGRQFSTPEPATLPHPSLAGRGYGSEHGYLFMFEVSPCAVDDDADVASSDGCVCLRARGEAVIGEGESAVSGYLNPTNDQLSVLVRLTNGHARRTDATSAMAVKVKVWNLTSRCCGGLTVSPGRPVPVPRVTTFNSTAPAMDTLR